MNRNSKRTIPVAAYYRMSSDGQDTSVGNQRLAVERYARDNSYKIVREYVDEAVSGWKPEREQFQQLVKDASSGEFQKVLCLDVDRFSRFTPSKFFRYVDILEDAGVSIVTVEDGELTFDGIADTILGVVRQHAKRQYSIDVSRKVLDGLVAKAQRGEWPMSTPPFGYRVDNPGLRKHRNGKPQKLILGPPAEVELVRTIFRRYLAGDSLRSIVQWLNRSGYKTARGYPWAVGTVARTLSNDVYVGDLVWNKQCVGEFHGVRNGCVVKNPRKGRTSASDWIVVRNAYPAIIDRATFAAVQQRRARCKCGFNTPHLNGGKFVLTGLLRCHNCGFHLSGRSMNGYQYFRCSGHMHRGRDFCDYNTVRQDILLDHVVSALEREYLNPRTIKRLREELHRQVRPTAHKVSVEQIRKQLEQVSRQLKKSKQRLVEVDRDMVSVVQEHIRDLQQQIDTLKKSLKVAQRPEKDLLAEQDAKVDAAMRQFSNLRDAFDKADTRALREFLQVAVEKIVVRVESHKRGKRYTYTLKGGEIHMRDNTELLPTASCP